MLPRCQTSKNSTAVIMLSMDLESYMPMEQQRHKQTQLMSTDGIVMTMITHVECAECLHTIGIGTMSQTHITVVVYSSQLDIPVMDIANIKILIGESDV